ncbi:NAD(P)-binding protein [Crucibulum laeve]|uniref:NAD(P)-binding protein n=1 Tax=Crucibulum laeve TaxID=68775 RepID=A0A5C3M847_9AGAR|nr:NAD(P)-binding protein [Crucibulum laeve]
MRYIFPIIFPMGSLWSIFRQLFPPAPRYSIDDIPDLTGKIIIVTGSNTGVGKETAKALLLHNAKVYIACRSQIKAEEAILDLEQHTGKKALFLNLDLGDLKSIKTAAEEFLSRETELHVLFNNAGVFIPPVELITTQGYDLQFGTNTLGHFYFTKLLIPVLLSTAKSNPRGAVRVVNTASIGHYLWGDLDFNTFKDTPARRKMTPLALYAQSKFGNVVFSNEMARRYGDQGIISMSVNPGNLRSDIQRHVSKTKASLVDFIFYYPVAYGALTQLWGGTSLEGAEFNGEYLFPWARMGAARVETKDPQIGKALWQWFEEQVQYV